MSACDSSAREDSRSRCRIEHRDGGWVEVLSTRIVPLAPLADML